MKALLIVFATVGSIIGAYIPSLWGDSNGLGLTSILLGGIGGIFGIWVGWKTIQYFE